jgi:GAF domain-containing protein
MTSAPDILPSNELERIAAVRRYQILDTPPDGTFDRITALASELFDVPIALVTIVDEDRIWFKSRCGLDQVQEIPRDPGLCASAILQDTPYIVEEVRGQFGLQFYAAAPLRTSDGYRLGTLCIIDREPRVFSPKQADVLDRLSQIVMDEMELRLNAIRAVTQARSS